MNDMTAALENVAALAKYEAGQEFADAKAQFDKQLLEARGAAADALRRCDAAEAKAEDAIAALGRLEGAIRAALHALSA